MMGWSPQCYILIFVEIGPPVLEKKFFEGFLLLIHNVCTKFQNPKLRSLTKKKFTDRQTDILTEKAKTTYPLYTGGIVNVPWFLLAYTYITENRWDYFTFEKIFDIR